MARYAMLGKPSRATHRPKTADQLCRSAGWGVEQDFDNHGTASFPTGGDGGGRQFDFMRPAETLQRFGDLAFQGGPRSQDRGDGWVAV
jgi:hypothetical protein